MQVQRVPAVSTRIAGLVDLFHSPSKLGTSNFIPTSFSVASVLIDCCGSGFLASEKKQCLRWRPSWQYQEGSGGNHGNIALVSVGAEVEYLTKLHSTAAERWRGYSFARVRARKTRSCRMITPLRLAHVVFMTRRYDEMSAWYETVFGASIVDGDPALSLTTYDDEHHRFPLSSSTYSSWNRAARLPTAKLASAKSPTPLPTPATCWIPTSD
jgi:hypothetical protein